MSGRIKNPDQVRWNLKFAILTKYGSETRFAQLIGISRQQLTHIIVGRNPGRHIRKRAAELLGKTVEFLFGGKNGNSNRYKAS